MYVVKFRGAGQGPRVLVAEWLAGEIARAIGLLVPDLVAVDLEAGIADSEPHQEIHDLLVASVGRNIGLDFLPGSLTFNPAVDRTPIRTGRPRSSGSTALVTNPDRSPKNPNLLVWHGRTWLIDHGASLSIHHTWRDPDAHARRSHAERLADHVLLPFASSIAAADERLAPLVTARAPRCASSPRCPTTGWRRTRSSATPDAQRRAYVAYLRRRLEAPRPFVDPAERLRRAAAA